MKLKLKWCKWETFLSKIEDMQEQIKSESVYSKSKRRFGKIKRRINEDYFEVEFSSENLILHRNDLIPIEKDPIERLKKFEVDDGKECILKAQSYWLLDFFKRQQLPSLSSSKIEIYPHQVSVVHTVCKEGKLRFLIADEVGLGKTIEASLILEELKLNGIIKKILIIVPASLVNQWKMELEQKFNEKFEVYDYFKEKSLKNEHPERNIWELNNQIICSLQYARNEKRQEDISKVHWDLVIIDEAHHLRRREEKTTKSYNLAKKISENCDYLLLITATPLQLEMEEFYALLELLDPEISKVEFIIKYRFISRINRIIKFIEKRPINKERFNHLMKIYEELEKLSNKAREFKQTKIILVGSM